MVDLGYNYRLSDVACALGISQLKKLDGFLEMREAVAKVYDAFFAKNPYAYPVKLPENIRSSRHLYPLLLDRSLWCAKEDIFRRCQEQGVGVQVHYKPIYQHTFYRERFGAVRLENAEDFYRAELSIPCHHGMSIADAEMTASLLMEIFTSFSGSCRV